METVEVDTSRKLAKLAKCSHPACSCTVSSGEPFCSDYCASQADADEAAGGGDCGCGHDECTTASATLEPEGLPAIGSA